MSRVSTSLLLLCVALLPCGCTTTPDTKPEDVYHPPAPNAPSAFLKGMQISEGGLFGTDHVGFVFMVDLKTVDAAADGWDKPLALTPGPHTIGVEYRQSNFHTRAHLPLQAQAGVTYQLMIKPGRDNPPEGPLYNEFWIVDTSTNRPVTLVYHRELMGGKKGTIFYMNK